MLFDQFFSTDVLDNEAQIKRLENFHQGRYSWVLVVILIGFIAFLAWANTFKIDQVARASGEVIASSRVQVIQAVDGGVLESLNVKEGDFVEKGQILAQLEQTRIGAAVNEIEARLFALQAKASRLKAEVIGAKTLVFSAEVKQLTDVVTVEMALFKQRKIGLSEELKTLTVAVKLAEEEVSLIEQLAISGDVNRSEVIRAERALNEAKAKKTNRKNHFLEEAQSELTKVEDGIAQNIQVLRQRQQQLTDSVFIAKVSGIVKNVRITTVGGVLRAGEELMQFVPVGDELIIEAKVRPVDIALVRSELLATIRFDPFDYTIYGGVKGKVVYVSPDTLKEDTRQGEEIYYRVHVSILSNPVKTTTGRELAILPGMTAQVDIKTGERTVMDYLLKPIRKTLSEAFTER